MQITKSIFFRRPQNFLVAVGSLLAVSLAPAQPVALDDAARPAYASGWANGTNDGFGFGPWVLADNNNTNTANYAGFFIGSAGVAAVDVTNKSFGLYANGTTYTYATAYRGLSNALTTSEVFTLKFKNTGIVTGGVMGFSLFNSASFAGATTYAELTGNSRFSFYFIGGDPNYVIRDGNVFTDSGVGWTSGGLTLEFALESADYYRLTIKNAEGTTILASFSGLPLQGVGGSAIDSIVCYNLSTAGNENAYFNQFAVVPTSLIPPTIQNVLPTNGAVYLPTSSTITFDAVSPFSGIATNGITVSLNGTNVTSYAFAGSATNWAVTAAPVLAANQTYNAQIVVADINGNHATNTFTFNTWSDTNLFIEAEAYNYNGGGAILNPFTGQYDAQAASVAVSNIDFLEFTDGGTNLYRTNDPVDLEVSGDAADHANYLGLGLTNWALDYVQGGEWVNYTRKLGANLAFHVYARMSGGGAAPVILMERAASPYAPTTNQPLAALGTFVGPDTGNIVSNYAFVPLKDFYGNTVAVRFAHLTNTFRLTRIGDPYNLDYLIFVPVADTNTQRPYLSAGYPYPGAGGVLPDSRITFTIANRQTTNVVAATKLYVNGVDVSGSLTFSNHLAGTTVTYAPATLYPLNTNSAVRAVFTDSGGVTQTNDWQFTVANILVIPAEYALPSGSGVDRGFNLRLVKYPDAWPGDATPAPLSSGWAEAVLAGNIINTNTGLPYPPDLATNFAELGPINYELCGTPSPDGYTFSNEVAFPHIPLAGYTPCANTNGPGSFALAATAYVQLNAGFHQWAVRSDDGFRLATGTGATPTNTLIMDWEGGRSAGTPSEFYFVIQTNGVYPIRLLYYQGGFGASVELYSIDRLTGEPILINDPANGNALPAWRSTTGGAAGVLLYDPQHSGSTTTFSFLTQAGQTHYVQYKNALTDPTWLPLQTVTGTGGGTNITDATASGAARFYRVETP